MEINVNMNNVREGGGSIADQLPLFKNEDFETAEVPTSRITTEQAHAFLNEHGLKVDLQQADKILQYLQKHALIYLASIPQPKSSTDP